MESGCSRVNGNRMAATQIPGKVFLKTLDLWTCREPSGFECLDDRLDLIFTDGGFVKGNEFAVLRHGGSQ